MGIKAAPVWPLYESKCLIRSLKTLIGCNTNKTVQKNRRKLNLRSPSPFPTSHATRHDVMCRARWPSNFTDRGEGDENISTWPPLPSWPQGKGHSGLTSEFYSRSDASWCLCLRQPERRNISRSCLGKMKTFLRAIKSTWVACSRLPVMSLGSLFKHI